jgi:hypothetical protein
MAKRLSDRGLEVLAAAADDPFARFAMRALTPFAKKGLDEIEGAVTGAIKRVREGLGEPEPARVTVRKGPVRAEVIVDAEIVDEKVKR